MAKGPVHRGRFNDFDCFPFCSLCAEVWFFKIRVLFRLRIIFSQELLEIRSIVGQPSLPPSPLPQQHRFTKLARDHLRVRCCKVVDTAGTTIRAKEWVSNWQRGEYTNATWWNIWRWRTPTLAGGYAKIGKSSIDEDAEKDDDDIDAVGIKRDHPPLYVNNNDEWYWVCFSWYGGVWYGIEYQSTIIVSWYHGEKS